MAFVPRSITRVSPAIQMEAQGEPVQVPERLDSDRTDRPLGDTGKEELAQLSEGLLAKARHAVSNNDPQQDREIELVARDQVDRFLVEDRDIDRRRLRQNKAGNCHHHPRPHLELTFRPEIGQQGFYRIKVGSRRRIGLGQISGRST